uniref:Amelogenin n=1 Tax=Amazona collaria TaxID=241587 RepID=A0A8B9IY28_9PSIT
GLMRPQHGCLSPPVHPSYGYGSMGSLPLLQHTVLVAFQHQLMQFPQTVPVLSAAQHQPSLPMPAQTEQLQAGEHPNLPEQPQHPANPNPMNPLPHLLLDMPLEPQQTTGKKKQEEIIRKIFLTSPLSHYSNRVC